MEELKEALAAKMKQVPQNTMSRIQYIQELNNVKTPVKLKLNMILLQLRRVKKATQSALEH